MTNRLTLAIIVASIFTLEGAGVKANAILLSSSKQMTQNLLPTNTNTESLNRRLNRNPQSLFLGLTYPAVPGSDTDTLVCYIPNLDGVDLNRANLVGANLDGAILNSANPQRSHSKPPRRSSF